MKDKEEVIIIWDFQLPWLHPSLLLPVLEADPQEDEDVEHEGGEGGGDAAEDPDGEGGEAPGVGGGGGQGGVEHVDEDEEGGDEEDAAGGVGQGRDEEAHGGHQDHQAWGGLPGQFRNTCRQVGQEEVLP